MEEVTKTVTITIDEYRELVETNVRYVQLAIDLQKLKDKVGSLENLARAASDFIVSANIEKQFIEFVNGTADCDEANGGER